MSAFDFHPAHHFSLYLYISLFFKEKKRIRGKGNEQKMSGMIFRVKINERDGGACARDPAHVKTYKEQ